MPLDNRVTIAERNVSLAKAAYTDAIQSAAGALIIEARRLDVLIAVAALIRADGSRAERTSDSFQHATLRKLGK